VGAGEKHKGNKASGHLEKPTKAKKGSKERGMQEGRNRKRRNHSNQTVSKVSGVKEVSVLSHKLTFQHRRKREGKDRNSMAERKKKNLRSKQSLW